MAAAVTQPATQCRYSFPEKAELRQRITRNALITHAKLNNKIDIRDNPEKIDQIIDNLVYSLANQDLLSQTEIVQIVNNAVHLYFPHLSQVSQLRRANSSVIQGTFEEVTQGLRPPFLRLVESVATKYFGVEAMEMDELREMPELPSSED